MDENKNTDNFSRRSLLKTTMIVSIYFEKTFHGLQLNPQMVLGCVSKERKNIPFRQPVYIVVVRCIKYRCECGMLIRYSGRKRVDLIATYTIAALNVVVTYIYILIHIFIYDVNQIFGRCKIKIKSSHVCTIEWISCY